MLNLQLICTWINKKSWNEWQHFHIRSQSSVLFLVPGVLAMKRCWTVFSTNIIFIYFIDLASFPFNASHDNRKFFVRSSKAWIIQAWEKCLEQVNISSWECWILQAPIIDGILFYRAKICRKKLRILLTIHSNISEWFNLNFLTRYCTNC